MADETKAVGAEQGQMEGQMPQVDEPAQPTDGGSKEEPKKTEKTYTEADIEKIINARLKRWEAQKEKEVDEAKRLAEMNATEKAEYERDKLQKELDELKQKDTLSRMLTETRRELAGMGINAPDEILNAIVSVDAEKTKEATKAFAELFNTAVNEAVTRKLSGTQHKTGQSAKLTKDDILAITDKKERQRKITENMELFKQ